MITAIVYQSNTGFTEKYAMMLAEATLLKVVALSEIKKAIKPKAEIIYLGWLRGGIISGLNKVRNKYQIKVIGAVGLLGDNEEYLEMVKKQNKIYETPLFYLPGGINREKQKGFNKWLFNLVIQILIKGMNKKPESEITEEELKRIHYMEHGCDFVSMDHLKELIDWYEDKKGW
ncbi:MAG TPA: hypothetical protein PKG96_01020 [Bacilli bacterium]|jgi:hypothetical protein|nr:hypothetical protein [Acholeplasmataceae bacterium]HNZ77336.1 hypothetical protein [Bacilli bacterium]HOD60679.1 hypothetical protein [Bacilli bacterium]HOH60928.1 hypothetical protein [Bacilli bacterium]HPB49191.1 hypothetical protein [Bacilli bacterium]